jgi:hypothetical protein
MQPAQAEAPAGRRVTKGQLATIAGVSAGRVSQWIAEGKIHGDALIGEGRAAQINLDIAQQQLGLTLDFDQRQAQALAKPAAPSATVTPEQQRIAAVKADMAEIELRKLQREERAAAGIYVLATKARQAWGRELTELMTAIEQWLPEVALQMAEAHGIDHKAATTLLRQSFRAFRTKRAAAARESAFAQPDLIDHGNAAHQSGADGAGGDGGGAGTAAAGGPEGLGGA